ncbi:DUF4192 domain-containing protein [Streptomyces boninensis]|uniref:DUF4192 domain-containing protein n=1 Tax=Streptomyces boninensis TaxID=2039455 RepID=UPI003B228965
MTTHSSSTAQITLRSPAELADALPYLMGFHPDDSIVLVALQGERGRFGGRLRLGIPRDRTEWSDVATQLAECLIEGSERRGARPTGVIAFLCQDVDGAGEEPRQVMDRLRPLAQRLRMACGRLEVPVVEALCISSGRYWSYCCPDITCCPPDGSPLTPPGTSPMAAAATYAGIQVRGSLRDMEARLAPVSGPPSRVAAQEKALDAAAAALVPRILGAADRDAVGKDTLALAGRLLARLRAAPRTGADDAAPEEDARDDELVSDEEAAAVVLGLQDRGTRDHAAEWMEGPAAAAALRLWRLLARRCVGAFTEHAAAPLTLAGWTAWSAGDEAAARVALAAALRADEEYVFARLLHDAVNEGLDPEPLRASLRKQRAGRRRQARGRKGRGGEATRSRRRTGPGRRPADGGGSGTDTGGGGGRRPVGRGRREGGES